MPKSQSIAFFEAISKDKQLAEEVKEVVDGQAANQEKAKKLLSLAKAHGFNFTKNEALSLTREELKTSLKIESLSNASGGAKGSIKPAVMAAFLLAGMGISGAAMPKMEASAAPPKIQAKQSVNSYDVYTADDFVNFFTREDYPGQVGRGVTINLRSDISLTADQAFAVMEATNGRNDFCGTLDGNKHSITLNFTTTRRGWFNGLFTYANGATFRNLHVQFNRLTGAESVLVLDAVNSTFDHVVISGNSIELSLRGQHNGEPRGHGSIAGRCSACNLTNCTTKIRRIAINKQMEWCGPSFVGGLIGSGRETAISGCAFSGDIDASSTGRVYAGGIVGMADSSYADNSSTIDKCVVSNSQIKATTNEECAAGALAGFCMSKSIVRNSAALNCRVNAPGNYTGQIAGAFVPEVGYSPFLLSEAFTGAAQDAPVPQMFETFYTSEGHAVGIERTPNLNAAAQEGQESIIELLPDLAPVIEQLQNPQGQQTGLVSSALKWVGSWFGLGGKK